MPILGPQREAPFCSEGGRLVLVITREGERVAGRHFPYRAEQAALELPVGLADRVLENGRPLPSDC